MELKVKEIPGPGEKSVQEVEKQLLMDDPIVDDTIVDDTIVDDPIVDKPVFGETDVLSFIKEKYSKDIASIDDLFVPQKEELPEDVSAFLNYKKETGRGISDFMKLQVDYDNVDQDKLLQDFYAATESDLDEEDISYIIKDKFSYDEEMDDESDIKARKIAKKKELAKAKKYFNEQKEMYKLPVESAGPQVDKSELDSYNAYKEYISKSQSVKEENARRSQYFQKKTEELFNDEFKGFEFKVGESKFIFNPGDTKEVKNAQSDVNNFISKFLDDQGVIKDAPGYHKALSAAMNPDKMAEFFYEKGKADAVGDVSKKSKNINMDVRSTPQQAKSKDGFTVRAISSSSGNGLKIKKR